MYKLRERRTDTKKNKEIIRKLIKIDKQIEQAKINLLVEEEKLRLWKIKEYKKMKIRQEKALKLIIKKDRLKNEN